MNKAKLLQSILELHKAVEDGNMEKMYRCAYELNALFEREVPEPLEGYDAALMRFKMAEAMVAFYMAVGKQSQAGTLRNRITAHYQAVRKSKEYSVSQKHELKEILRRIKVIVPSQRNVATKLDKNAEEYKRSVFVFRAQDWFSELHGMLPLEGLEYLKPFNVSSLLSTLPLDMPKSQVVEEMTKYCYDKGGSLAPRSLQRQYKVGGKQAKHLYVIGNGFDRYHGAESGYMSFRRYLFRRSPQTVGRNLHREETANKLVASPSSRRNNCSYPLSKTIYRSKLLFRFKRVSEELICQYTITKHLLQPQNILFQQSDGRKRQ